MTLLAATLVIVLLAVAGMGVGLLCGGRPLRGGCHATGLECAPVDCEACPRRNAEG